ncbi:MAG: DUF1727 domain-containing protein [Dehalococcoidia bacterium]|nr:DUF1727 domain-containing protein [Dehalococcoidia bacterium]
MSRATGRGPSMRQRTALLAGRGAGEAARRLGRGGGTALPGLVAGTLAPGLVEALAGQLGHGAVTVTGTNGKTTTAHLLSTVARAAGLEPLANASGSNLERGLVTAYVDAAGWSGRVPRARQRLGVLEVDEAALPPLWPRIRPRAGVFLNLFRDQLDRYGEVDSVAEGWRRMVARGGPATLVLNVDDPSIAQLAEESPGAVVGFGVEDPAVAIEGSEHASDARFCRCGARLTYDGIYMGHVGRWRCEACGRVRPAPGVAARHVELGRDETCFDLSVGGEAVPMRLPLAGLYSVYNALAAAAAAHALGIPVAAIASALGAAGPAFGRQERFDVDGREVRVLLAKNPAGLNQIVRTLGASPTPPVVLAMLNDGIQDGQDVSWIYDADLERLAGRVGPVVCSGRRAPDLALRLALAGIEPAAVDADCERALDLALAHTERGARLEVVPTYTAMLEVREALARRAGGRPYWEREQR